MLPLVGNSPLVSMTTTDIFFPNSVHFDSSYLIQRLSWLPFQYGGPKRVNSCHPLGAYLLPYIVHAVSHWSSWVLRGRRYFCLHFTDEETEDQRVDLRLHGSSGLVGTKIRSVWSQNLVLNYPSNFKANREVFDLSFVVCYSGTSGLHGSSVFSSYIYDCARS